MKSIFILVIFLIGCSTKAIDIQDHRTTVAHLEVLTQSSAIVADVEEPVVIEAIVKHPRSGQVPVSVEWVSIKDGLVGVHKPDHNGLVQFNTTSLSVGWHSLFVRLKYVDTIIQEHRVTVFVQESFPSQNSLLRDYKASYELESAKAQSPLLSNNRLSGCDVHTRSKNIWFCPDYTPAD